MEAKLRAEEIATFTGARRIGMPPRNYGPKRLSKRSQQVELPPSDRTGGELVRPDEVSR
jgi:hypothetical protein